MVLIECGDRLRERDRAGKRAAVILRAPIPQANRLVHDRRRRPKSVRERGGVDIRLERGARLAQRVGRAVELAPGIVAPAHHRAHRAVEIGQHGGGLARVIVAAVLAQRILHRGFRGALQIEIERGAHHEHALDQRVGECVDQLLHLFERPVEVIVGRRVVAPIHGDGRIAPRAEHLTFAHETGFDEIIEHDVGARARGRQVDVRGIARRRLEHPGQHGGFRQIHVARRFVEIVMRRRVHAERAGAEIGALEIELEDVVFRKPRFQPQRQKGLAHLALDRALVRQEQVLGELLRDGGAALHHAAGARIGEQRAEGAGDVDAEVLVEAPVFRGERRLDQMVGKVVDLEHVVVLDAAAADGVAVAVEERDRELGFFQPVVVGGFLEGGNRERQHQHQAGRADGCPLGGDFDAHPPPAGDVEAVHEGGIALVQLGQPAPGLEQGAVDARVGIEHEPPKPRLPALAIGVALYQTGTSLSQDFRTETLRPRPSRQDDVGDGLGNDLGRMRDRPKPSPSTLDF